MGGAKESRQLCWYIYALSGMENRKFSRAALPGLASNRNQMRPLDALVSVFKKG
jgi:hypothetical protein